MNEIIIPTLTLGILGAIFGIGLSFASKKFEVKIDPRLEKITGLLPGANCGACGQAGCFGLAEEILSGKQSVNACRVIDEKNKEKISEILGQKLDKHIKKMAICHCGGGAKVKNRFIYTGKKDCVWANTLLSGNKECLYGCLGLETCVNACPFGAIKLSAENLPIIDPIKCKACNKCVIACPKKLFSLMPHAHKVYVACSSHDCAKDTRVACPVGCIGCKMCEKTCKFGAIQVKDNLAVIDNTKCTSCGECVKVCPRKIIKILTH